MSIGNVEFKTVIRNVFDTLFSGKSAQELKNEKDTAKNTQKTNAEDSCQEFRPHEALKDKAAKDVINTDKLLEDIKKFFENTSKPVKDKIKDKAAKDVIDTDKLLEDIKKFFENTSKPVKDKIKEKTDK